MLKNEIELMEKYQRFIKKVVKDNEVYILFGDGGSAISTSLHFTNSDGQDCPVLCVWHSQSLAEVNKTDDWSDYKIKKINLAEFLENWCLGMSADEVVAGIDFDLNMFGKEEDPLVLALNIVQELEHNHIEPHFKHFTNLIDYKATVQEAIDNDN